MTLAEIVAETRHWPAARRVELVDRLNSELVQDADPAIAVAWAEVASRRLDEVERGTAELIPGETVMARAREILRR